MDSLLLHVCCGPCSTVPIKLLSHERGAFTAFFSNSNIDTQAEYDQRLATFKDFANTQQVPVIAAPYEPYLWEEAVKEYAGVFPLIDGDPSYNQNLTSHQARCRACYAFRFKQLALAAAQLGYRRISTTLSISPYQFTPILAQELERAATEQGLEDAFVDYRFGYQDSVAISRDLGMYRQNYCGCRFSQAEAQLERDARKAARKAEKEKKARLTQKEAHGFAPEKRGGSQDVSQG